MSTEHDIAIEVDGDGIHPGTVDALAFSALVRAYLDGLAKYAALKRTPLRLVGFEIVDKCIEARTTTVDIAIAQIATRELLGAASGDHAPPEDMRIVVRDLQKARRLFGSATVRARVGTHRYVLGDTRPSSPPLTLTTESLRGRVTAVFGGDKPHVRMFTEDHGIGVLNLYAKADLVHELGGALDRLVDVEASVDWSGDASVELATITSYQLVDEDGDAYEIWRKWARRHLDIWDDSEGGPEASVE